MAEEFYAQCPPTQTSKFFPAPQEFRISPFLSRLTAHGIFIVISYMTLERWNTPKREWNNCAFACHSEVTCSTHPPICGLWQKTQVLFTLFVPLQTSSDHYLKVRQDVCFEGWRGNGNGVGCRSEELGAALPAAEWRRQKMASLWS